MSRVTKLFVMVVNIVINSIIQSKLGNRDEKFYFPNCSMLMILMGGSWLDPVGRRRKESEWLWRLRVNVDYYK